MNVLVTGGAGWIGKHVVAQLGQAGHTARVMDAKRAGGDIRMLSDVLIAVEGCDAVIHLAGVLGTHELFESPYRAVNVNVTGTLNVLEACRKFGASFVGISMPDVNPSLYAATKVCAQRMAAAYHNAYDIGVSHVVAYNAYGPGQAYGDGHPRKIIPSFSVAGWTGEPIIVWGDGKLFVDLVHVEDVAQMLVCALDYTKGEVLHAGTGRATSVLDVAYKVQKWTGLRSPVVKIAPRKGERRRSTSQDYAPSDRMTLQLGWLPEFSWERIRETVESYK